MNNLNKNQKIITIIIVLGITIAGICYYIYTDDRNFSDLQNQVLECEQKQTNNTENNITEENNTGSNIVVHVSGAVNKEGIANLKENSRIADAIEAAGGMREEACIDEINLAYILEDGMKIYIPTKEEISNQEEKETKEYVITSSESNAEENKKSDNNSNQSVSANKNTNSSNTKLSENSKTNINKATQTELEALPGIGPAIAVKIINYREQQSKFKTIEEIKNVSGIGDSKFNNIKDFICI